MARPKTKQELIQTSNTNFQKLWKEIDSLSEKEFNAIFDFSEQIKLKEAHWKRDRNVRDILIHLYEWHQLAIKWIEKNQSGENAKFLPKDYTFQTIASLNSEFWKKHQTTDYEKAVKLLKNSHQEIMKKIDSFTEEGLFTKKYFPWTGTTSLGSYCISATSSHYDWAIKKLKKHKKSLV